MVTEVDVAVVGAGPAGSDTARRLAGAGYTVLLLERSEFDEPRIGESLAPSVETILRAAGLWESIAALGPVPSFGTKSHWGAATAQIHSHLWSVPGRGWHVDRAAFDRSLATAASEAGAELRCGTAVTSAEPAASAGWVLQLASPTDVAPEAEPIRARVVVDATGRAAHVARAVGAARVVFDRLVGIASYFELPTAVHEGYILIEATPAGWWYSAPVPDGMFLVAFMTDGDIARSVGLTREAAWERELDGTAATRDRIRSGARRWGPRVYSARSQYVRQSDAELAWIAVGDAGLAVDPVSGSGVVRALRSAEQASRAVADHLETGSPQPWHDYERHRLVECDRYLHERAAYYNLETRWPEARFWDRRRAAGSDEPVPAADEPGV